MIKDRNVAWNRKREFIPAAHMTGLLEATNLITSLGAGAAVFQEALAAAEVAGLAIGAAGDEIYHFWPLPWDFDRAEPIRFRLWFTHSAVDADTPDWVVSYKAIGKQDAISDAKVSADENVAFAATAVSTTANAMEILDWKESVSDTKITSTDKALLMAIECNGLGGALANEISFFGLEIEYTVGACIDSNQRDITRNAPVAA